MLSILPAAMSENVIESVSWEALIRGTCKAFSSYPVKVDTMKNLMAAYKSNESDWMRFAKSHPNKYVKSHS